jgi:hypothetical protein
MTLDTYLRLFEHAATTACRRSYVRGGARMTPRAAPQVSVNQPALSPSIAAAAPLPRSPGLHQASVKKVLPGTHRHMLGFV